MKFKNANLSDSIRVKKMEQITSITVDRELYAAVKEKLKLEGKSFHDLVNAAMQIYLNDKNQPQGKRA